MSLQAVSSALAGRYSVEREIGSGGMATVYLAFDARHERRVAIKVLRPALAEALGGDRFIREIKIAASLSHPNILPLYDSGEAGGLLYYVMPLVEGESLRDRLDREKQLPVEDALEIASQVCSALSYAHSRGVIHRDIKPDNILLSSGQAVVADFGLARALEVAGGSALTGTGMALGTPAYMSPEQATGTSEVDARADQYSLACTLFEMLAGEPPFAGRTVQAILARQMTESAPNLTSMRDVVPASLATAVRRAMAKTPADRFATVSQFADALRAPASDVVSVPRRRFFRRPAGWIATTASLAAVAGAAVVLSASHPVPFEQRDWILVTDFDNRTGDTLFDGSLDRAFAVGLQQSRYVNVFPRSRVGETLVYMERDPASPLDDALAREVALRQAVRVVVSPAITRLGSRYSLTTNVIEPETGDILVARSAEAESADRVLNALDELARQLRKDLGEPLLNRLRDNVQLDQATTPSLEALRAWSSANERWGAGDQDAAARLYNRAVELDSNFAIAHVDLGQYYYWRYNDRERGDAHFEKALGLTERVTQRERWVIEAKSAGWQGDGQRAIETYRILLASYPDDQVQWNNLGFELLRLGRYDDAAEAYRRSLALDSLDHNAMINLATVYGAMEERERAVETYRLAFELNPGYRVNATINEQYGMLLAALGQFQAAEEAFGWMLSENRELQSRGHRSMALLHMRRGQYDDAIANLRRSVLLDETGSPGTTTMRNRSFLAAALLTRQGNDAAMREVGAIMDVIESTYIEPHFLAIAGRLVAEVGDVDAAQAVLDTLARRVDDRHTDQAAMHFLAGHVALARNDPDSALGHFERGAVFTQQQNSMRAFYLAPLALTQIMLDRTSEARSTLGELIATGNSGREDQEPWILAHYQLARLHDEAGETEAAIAMYDQFLNLWDQADDGLAPVAEARRRLASLTQGDQR
jgi:serine/threonine-protein kinase